MRASSAYCAALLLATISSVAHAQGSLTVSLADASGRPVEGNITATPAGPGIARGCSTRGGECVVSGLPAGQYQVGATTLRGGAAVPRVVVVRNGPQRLSLTASDAAQQQAPNARGRVAPARTGSSRSGSTTAGQITPGGLPTAQVGGFVPPTRPIGSAFQGPNHAPVRSDQPAATSPNAQMAAASAPQGSRDLGAGRSVSVTGSAQDQRGRPVEGTVTVTAQGLLVGTTSSRGGAFQLFDLEPGQYELSFAAITGQHASRQAAVRAGAQTRVVLTIQR